MSDLTEFLLARMTEERMREFTCSWCDASPGLPCRTGHGRVIAAAHSYRRKAAINSGRLPILGQDEDDEYLAIVERQRAEALATIERVKNVIRAQRQDDPGVHDGGALRRAYQQGRRDATAVFRVAIEGTS